MEEQLNGFTGFAKRKDEESLRYTQRPAEPRDDAGNEADGAAVEFDEEKLARIADTDRRWAWVEIDRSAIRWNVKEVKRLLEKPCHLMAVVKADGYGHGAIECARAALSAGADYLGVATLNEGIELRDAGITAPILMLAQPPVQAVPLLLARHIMPSIYTCDFAIAYAEAADMCHMDAPFHLAVNTGMNRIGVRFDDVVEFMTQISFHRALKLEGVFTHFATADAQDTFDIEVQSNRFAEAVTALQDAGVNPGIVHCANSATILRYPQLHYDMVRMGISLYGYHPCDQTRRTIDLHPAMSVHARITDTRLAPMGEGVSYGLNYRCNGSVKICTLPIGYADGLRRAWSGNIDFLLGGRRMRQVGNICMDQCMFEVDMRSRISAARIDPQIGDEVVIAGRQGNEEITIDELAAILGSIPHEVTIGFSHRMPRIYR